VSEYPLTVIAFWIAVYFLVLHDFIKFIRSLFSDSKGPSGTSVPLRKKFNGSAATYVR
jgi:hypothetical protein